MRKPAYSLTRQAFWLSFVLAWLVILGIVGFGLLGSRNAVELAAIVVPSMILLIAALLGIHRFSGALDMRSMAVATLPDRGDEP